MIKMSTNKTKPRYVKTIEDLYPLLVYYHLHGHININIMQSRAYSTTYNSHHIGYGIYYSSNWGAIIKNDIRYQIDYDSIDIVQLYKYLKNNAFIKSMGLKVNYSEFDDAIYYNYKWRSFFRKDGKCIYLTYNDTLDIIPIFYIKQ